MLSMFETGLSLLALIATGYVFIVVARPRCYKCGKRTRIEWWPKRSLFECKACETERLEMVAKLEEVAPPKVTVSLHFHCPKCDKDVGTPGCTIGTAIWVRRSSLTMSDKPVALYTACPLCEGIVQINGDV